MHIIRENIYHLEEGELLTCWQQFLEGNSEAFGQIISCYYAALFQYGIKIHADKAFVQDSIQDMATDLWSKRERLSRQVHVKSYLFKSLRHKMIRQLQRRDVQQRHLLLWGQGALAPFDAEFSVEAAIIDNETNRQRKQLLYDSLKSLSPRQQEIIYLRYFQNLEHDQVAAIMKLSRVAVYNLLSSSLKRLKSQIGPLSSIALLLSGKYF